MTLVAAVLLAGDLTSAVSASETRIEKRSLKQLEERLSEIDSELERLASYSLRTGLGSVGYRSEAHRQNTDSEWIQIELGENTPIDEVVLVPAIWRDTKTGFRADGFPTEFRLVAGQAGDTNGSLIASCCTQDNLLPRIAPLVISFPSTNAAWVRLEAVNLSPRAWDGLYILQLSEIMIFSGEENAALHKQVRTSGQEVEETLPRGPGQLVDGSIPYLMDSYEGEQSLAFVTQIGIGKEPSLTIDLETVVPVNRIHLHPTDLSDTVPQSTPPDFGVPRKMVIEGAALPDFSDAVKLTEHRVKSLFDVNPVMMFSFPARNVRYLRLTAVEPYVNTEYPSETPEEASQLGFAEIEVFSRGRNIALNKQISASFEVTDPAVSGRSIEALTDGRNLYGNILPLRQWMAELALRHDLQSERPVISAELGRRYARQKTIMTSLVWLAVMLVVAILLTVLIERITRARQMAGIRERFAADLHDELGANLHAIGLLGDLAKDAVDSREELIETVDEIRAVTERTSAAARYCADMQSAGLHESLPDSMHRAARRIMADTEYDISIEGEEILNKLNPRTITDLSLFYKESLVNISRHSGATKVSTQVAADRKQICLTVSDNGMGISVTDNNGTPPSLKRRAHLLGADVSAERPSGGGTCIKLKLKLRKKRRMR